MANIPIPYVTSFRDRHGRERFRFRRKGCKTAYLPDPTSPTFTDAYRAALSSEKPKKEIGSPRKEGSFGALVQDYLNSPEFQEKAETTQAEYKRSLLRMEAEHGEKPVKLIERKHVFKWRDELRDTPGAANTMLGAMKVILSFAVERDYRSDNPALRVKKFKLGEWRSWTDEEIEQFKARWPTGSMQRRAFALALYTGQRRGDLIVMTRGHCRDGSIAVKQNKTGTELAIPEHPELTAELVSVSHMSLLTNEHGRAFEEKEFSKWFARAIDAAGLPVECVLHGLRKAAARCLAEAGCTEDEIKAITGHVTSAMISKYTRGTNQKRQAHAAITKLSRERIRGGDG